MYICVSLKVLALEVLILLIQIIHFKLNNVQRDLKGDNEHINITCIQ